MLKRFILWDYRRGSWQYDMMVGIILAFIFLTPRDGFGDRPRIPKASSMSILPSEHAGDASLWTPDCYRKTPENQRIAKLTDLLQSRMSDSRLSVTRLKPILDSEGELQGYMAFARP